MITIFNRKELLVTYDLSRLSTVKMILRTHDIPYHTKIFNNDRHRNGVFPSHFKYQIEYKLYVKKIDYPKAVYLINHHSS